MTGKIKYNFTAPVWQYASAGGWYFVSLPEGLASEIRTNLQWQEEGWGRLKVVAAIGTFSWETSIWFDTKLDTYLLPIKAEVRKKADVRNGDFFEFTLWI